MIERKVNATVNTILKGVIDNLDMKLDDMRKAYDKKLESSISKIVQDKLKQIKQQSDKNSMNIAANVTKLGSLKTLTGKNKTDIASHGLKINELKNEMNKVTADISGQSKRCNQVKMQSLKNTDTITECEGKVKGIETSLDFYSKEIEDLKKQKDRIQNLEVKIEDVKKYHNYQTRSESSLPIMQPYLHALTQKLKKLNMQIRLKKPIPEEITS